MDGIAEEAIEERPRRADLGRLAHLAENLSLSGDERVEAGGHAEEMDGGGMVVQPIEDGQLPEHRGRALLGRFRVVGREVELRSIAGGEADCLPPVGGQHARHLRGLLLPERDELAQLDGGEPVRRSHQDEAAHESAPWAGRAGPR